MSLKENIKKLFGKKPKAQEQVKKNFTLVKGVHIFEMSLITGKVKLAVLETLEGGGKKLIENGHCIYIPARDKIIAIKKFNKIIKGATKE